MTDEGISVFACGSSSCPQGGEHEWNGAWAEFNTECTECSGSGCNRCGGTGQRACGASTTCSKCGQDRMSYDLWNCP